jgi:hypothetical protein
MAFWALRETRTEKSAKTLFAVANLDKVIGIYDFFRGRSKVPCGIMPMGLQKSNVGTETGMLRGVV